MAGGYLESDLTPADMANCGPPVENCAVLIKANRLTGGGVQQVAIADATVFSLYLKFNEGSEEWKFDIPKSGSPAQDYSAVFTAAAGLSMQYSAPILPFSFDEKRK